MKRLSEKNMMQVLQVITYLTGIINRPKTEVETANIKTRKVLTMKSAFHPQSNIQRQVDGSGRGLGSGKTIVLDESIHETAQR